MARSARVELILDTLRAQRGARDLSRETDKVADSLADTAREGVKAGKVVDDAGGDMSQAARAAQALDRRMEELTGSLKDMAIAQTLTGENFSKQIRQQETELRRLSRSRKLLGVDAPIVVDVDPSPADRKVDMLARRLSILEVDPIDLDADPQTALAQIDRVQEQLREVARNTTTARVRIDAEAAGADLSRLAKRLASTAPEAAAGFATSFASRVGPLLARAPIAGGPIGVGLAVLAAPVIAGTIASAVIGGAGVGGVVGGFMVVKDDVRVKAATDALGDRLEGRLQRAAGALVDPALKGIDDIDRALGTVDFDQIFRDSARYMPMLTAGVSSAITDLGDGIESLSANAGPVIDVLSRGLAGIGSSLGSGLESLSDNAELAAVMLDGLFKVVDYGITGFFATTNAILEATEAVQWFGEKVASVHPIIAVLTDVLPDLGAGEQQAAQGATQMGEEMRLAGVEAEALKQRQEELRAANDVLRQSQDDLNASVDGLNPAGQRATMAAGVLKRAMDSLYGAAINQTEANEGYEASWDSLTESVKANGRSLNVHSAAGRANRDALQALLSKSNEMYVADIAAGVAVDEARKKHEKRTGAIRTEAGQLSLNKTRTEALIKTYGKIPPEETTKLLLDGVKDVVEKMTEIYWLQRAHIEGKTVAQAKAGFDPNKHSSNYRNDPFQRRAAGGQITGWSPSPTADNLLIRATADEFMIRQPSARKMARTNPGALEHINRYGEMPPGFAAGGLIAPVQTRTRGWYPVDESKTFILSREEALKRVIPRVPRGTSGPWMERMLERMFGVSMISGYRPGSRTLSGALSYHALNRAVDFPPLRAMAKFMHDSYGPRLREAITPWHEFNIHNGRPHRYTGAVWRQHAFGYGNAHNHFAMANGGVVREPVFGYGLRTGSTYSIAERGPERVLSTAETMSGIGGGSAVLARLDALIAATQSRRGGRVQLGPVYPTSAVDVDLMVNRLQFAMGGL